MSAPAVTAVVVGAGISGLAAAWELSALLGAGAGVVVLEGTDRVGGKLRTASVGGVDVDVGAESMLARRPEAVGLVADAGLGDRLVHPTGVGAGVWSRGALWPLPAGTMMGVPADPADARGILDADEVLRARDERVGPPVDGDVSVGDFVAERFGDAVTDRLVEPLLAGVYAGHSRRLSLQACVPALWQAAVAGSAVLGHTSPGNASVGPVFAGYRGGLGLFSLDLADALRARGVQLRTGSTVREVGTAPAGRGRWRLTIGPPVQPVYLDAEVVVLAVPAAPTGRLLSSMAAGAAAELGAVEHASVALATYAVRRDSALAVATEGSSGFLVPPVEPATIKASTFSASKWAWVGDLDPGLVHLRVSVGRAGEAATLHRPDRELTQAGLVDLERVLGVRVRPRDVVDAHLQRWGGGLPQYAVGHLDRVARVRSGRGVPARAGGRGRVAGRGGHPRVHRRRSPRGAGRRTPARRCTEPTRTMGR